MKGILGSTGLIALVLAILACGSIPSLPGAGAQPTSLADLWPDVPRMDGMTLSTDIQAPPFVHVLLTLVTKQILGEGKDSGDWVDFTTAKTPDDVKAFYTPELMTAAGWEKSDKSTCIAGAEQGVPQVGQVCFFIKHPTGKQVGLIIIASQDDSTKKTNVFFVRVETIERTPTPSS